MLGQIWPISWPVIGHSTQSLIVIGLQSWGSAPCYKLTIMRSSFIVNSQGNTAEYRTGAGLNSTHGGWPMNHVTGYNTYSKAELGFVKILVPQPYNFISSDNSVRTYSEKISLGML